MKLKKGVRSDGVGNLLGCWCKHTIIGISIVQRTDDGRILLPVGLFLYVLTVVMRLRVENRTIYVVDGSDWQMANSQRVRSKQMRR